MDTNHVLKPTISINNSFFSKIMRFLGAALLADLVLGNALNVFVENLNKKGLLGLGPDFSPLQILWGDSFWLNIIHILIIVVTAGIFGFILGYTSRRLSLSEKIVFTFCYVFIRWIFLALVSLMLEFFLPNAAVTWKEIMGFSIYLISSSVFNSTFVLLGYALMFASSFFFIGIGSMVINNPYHTTDKSKSGTLLDVKWYHYFWLFIPISFYIQILLNLVYRIVVTIIELVSNFKWHTILGSSDGQKGNAIDVAWNSLIFIFFVSIIVVYLMNYLKQVLSSETDHSWFAKLLISIGIGFVLPFLIYFYTSLAG